MRHVKALVILGVVTVAAVTAAALYQRDTAVVSERGELVFPDLLSKVNDTTEIEATSKGETFTLRRTERGWVMPEKSDYRADGDKVHQLIVGAADLKRLEPKTSNPDLYPKIGLDDPTSSESEAVRFALNDANGGTVAAFVLGQDRPAKGNPALTEFYLRLPDDPQSWLVEGKLPRVKRALDWLDKSILSLDQERIREVRVTHPQGDQVLVRKGEPSQADFELAGVPEGMQVDGQWRVNDIGRGMTDLQLDDVRADSEPPEGATSSFVLELLTFDGLKVTMRTTQSGEDTYARLEASYDESAVAAAPADEPDDVATDTETPSGAGAKVEPDEDASDAESVQAEAESLNRRWQGWLYQLPRYKTSYFAKRMGDLTKPVETESTGEEDPAKSS